MMVTIEQMVIIMIMIMIPIQMKVKQQTILQWKELEQKQELMMIELLVNSYVKN